jgi:hypothetical protein
VALVHRLEVVDVKHQQAQRRAAAAGARDLPAQGIVEGEPVSERGQLISAGEFVHPGRIGGLGDSCIPGNGEHRPGMDARFSPG